jgi:hypothetical protein
MDYELSCVSSTMRCLLVGTSGTIERDCKCKISRHRTNKDGMVTSGWPIARITPAVASPETPSLGLPRLVNQEYGSCGCHGCSAIHDRALKGHKTRNIITRHSQEHASENHRIVVFANLVFGTHKHQSGKSNQNRHLSGPCPPETPPQATLKKRRISPSKSVSEIMP